MDLLKRLAARLPLVWQLELKRLLYRRRIRRGRLVLTADITEPEYKILEQFVSPGDCVVDIGANVGYYTKRLSDLVGSKGRVLAVEPVPETFALLAANVALFDWRNVTLLNVAASDRTTTASMRLPTSPTTGLTAYTRARIATGADLLRVLTLAIDAVALDRPVTLIKIDAEGHDAAVLRGLERTVARDHPTLIVETATPAVHQLLADLGYRAEVLPNSRNTLFRGTRGSDPALRQP